MVESLTLEHCSYNAMILSSASNGIGKESAIRDLCSDYDPLIVECES